jgi:hypothetical protein
MKNEFEEITNCNKKIIYKLWEEYPFKNNEIVPVGKKDKSYEFAINGKDALTLISENLANYFSIDNKPLFYKKVRMVCSGNGGEGLKITTLHSSSLCALLFFYNVCEDNSLTIEKIPGYEFVDSVFEFKNKVIGYPSNIDVVLLGHKKSQKDEKIILFLESKFSEYITGITTKDSKYEVGKSYFTDDYSKPFYKEEFLKSLQLERYEEKSKTKTYLRPTEEAKYIEGIKQMISHYVGIRKFIKGDYFYNDDEEVLKLVKGYSDGKIILGEILFDNFEKTLDHFQKNYEKDYSKLAKKINEETKKTEECKNFSVLEKVINYSEIKGFIKNPTIRKFYFGEEKQ